MLNDGAYFKSSLGTDGGGYVGRGVAHEDGPAAYEHKQGDGGFVDPRDAFDGNEKITDNKDCDDGKGQCTHLDLLDLCL